MLLLLLLLLPRCNPRWLRRIVGGREGGTGVGGGTVGSRLCVIRARGIPLFPSRPGGDQHQREQEEVVGLEVEARTRPLTSILYS